jgi:tetratricopeptide (TPR) repeat protein
MPPDLLQTAVAHHQAGRLDQAEALYRQVLARDPGQADALHLLGLLTHQRGRHAQAAELIERAIGLRPGEAVYHSNLAEVYRLQGDLPRAEATCRQALALAPDNPEALNILGLVHQQAGRFDEAVAAFTSLIAARPSWPPPYVHLGTLLRQRGSPDEAMALWREGVSRSGDRGLHLQLASLLLERDHVEEAMQHFQELYRQEPNNLTVLMNLGNALAALGRRDEARGLYRRVIALAPQMSQPYAHLGLLDEDEARWASALAWFDEAARRQPADPGHGCHAATALHEMGRTDEALARIREVIRLYPDHAPAYNTFGYLVQDRGDMPAARAAYQQATRLKPDYADAFRSLGLLLLETGETEQALAALREALRHDPDHPEALGDLGVALRERLPADEEAACEWVLSRGRLTGRRRAGVQYGLAQVMDGRGRYDRAAELARQANDYLREEARQRGRGYDPAEHHAHVEKIIRAYSAAHFERVQGWGNESELPVFVVGLPRSGTSLVEQILASHPQVHGAGELNLMSELNRSLPGLAGRQAPAVECVDALTREHVEGLAQHYLSHVRGLHPSASRIIDKMPDNYLLVGLIATLLPRARIIHTRRDVRDTGLSCWLTHFRSVLWACDLRHIGERIREYLRLMEHWRGVLPGRIFEIDYEEVVADVESAARRLVAWCDLEWDSACLAFHATRRVVRTASMAQVREPIYARSVGRWRHYRAYLGPLVEIVGEGME